jgi:hypothetical protein
VYVGVTHDTAEFAVETIRCWWKQMGIRVYPKTKELLITTDGGRGNGAKIRLWKVELQTLADELAMIIHVRHFPPATSKWNKVEYRLFYHITENWRSCPLESLMAVMNLISNTKRQKD